MPGPGVPREACFRGLGTVLNTRCVPLLKDGRNRILILFGLFGLDPSIDWLYIYYVLRVVHPVAPFIGLQHLRLGREARIQ
jgi:hypothetical protein